MKGGPYPEDQSDKCEKAEDKSFPDPVNEQENKDAEDNDVEVIHGSLLQP